MPGGNDFIWSATFNRMSFIGSSLPCESNDAIPNLSRSILPVTRPVDSLPTALVNASVSTPDCCAANRHFDASWAVSPR
jgi:hypothetical protein